MMNNQKLNQWIESVKKRKKEISKMSPKDRLDLCSEIASLHGDLIASLGGWLVWLKNPKIMNQLTEEELKETFGVFKKIATDFMELDIKMSTAVSSRINKIPKTKETKGQKSSYVA